MLKFVLVIVAAVGPQSGVDIDATREFTDPVLCSDAATAINRRLDANPESRIFGTRATCIQVSGPVSAQ